MNKHGEHEAGRWGTPVKWFVGLCCLHSAMARVDDGACGAVVVELQAEGCIGARSAGEVRGREGDRRLALADAADFAHLGEARRCVFRFYQSAAPAKLKRLSCNLIHFFLIFF